MKTAPKYGYILNEVRIMYRATAIVEMKRVGAKEIQSWDGKTYTIEDLENSIINYKN